MKYKSYDFMKFHDDVFLHRFKGIDDKNAWPGSTLKPVNYGRYHGVISALHEDLVISYHGINSSLLTNH